MFRFSNSQSGLTGPAFFLVLFLLIVFGSVAAGEELPLRKVHWGRQHEVKAMALDPILGSYMVVSGCYPKLVSNNIGYSFLVDSLYVEEKGGNGISTVNLPRLHNRKSQDWWSPIAISPITGLGYQVHQEKMGGFMSNDPGPVDHRCRLTILDPFTPGRSPSHMLGGRRSIQYDQVLDLISYPEENRFLFSDNSGRIAVTNGEFFSKGMLDPNKVPPTDDETRCLALSPDNKRVATGLKNGLVRVYAIGAWEQTVEFEGHDKDVNAISYHPNGQLLISGGEDKQIIVWDTKSGQEVRRFTLKEKVKRLAVSPDGSFLAVTDKGKGLRLLDLETGDEIGSAQLRDEGHSLAFHPLGLALLVADDDNLTYVVYLSEVPRVANQLEVWRRNPEITGGPLAGRVAAALGLRELLEIEKEQRNVSAGLDSELAQRLGAEIQDSPKDEFESQAEYQARVKRANDLKQELRAHYARLKEDRHNEALAKAASICQDLYALDLVKVVLGTYDADKQQYSLSIRSYFLGQPQARKVQLQIPRAEARQLKENWDHVEFSGKARLRTLLAGNPGGKISSGPRPRGRCELMEIALRDTRTNSYYALDLSQNAPVVAAKEFSAGLPPELHAVVSFEDPSGNDMLDAEEEGGLWISVTNSGKGSAFGVRVEFTPRTIPSLKYYPQNFGEVRPGETRKIKVPVVADLNVEDGEHTLAVDIPAAEGFRAPRTEFTFKTRAVRPPDLTVTDVGVDDASQNGVIEPGEVVAITARIQNLGYGYARDVKADVRFGDDVFLAAGSQAMHSLGRLDPGQYKDVEFRLYTNQNATDLPVFIDLSEGTEQFGKPDNQLPLAFSRPMQSIQKVYVAGKAEQKMAEIEAASGLGVDVDIDVPQTAMDNPDAVALVMGVLDYASPQIPRAKYAKRDAQAIRRYLVDVMGYNPENILPRDPEMVMTSGTMKNLMRNVLPSYLKEGRSDVFVYFSGHGAPSTNTQEPFLVPYDCDPNAVNSDNAYSMNEFYTDLAALKSRSLVVVVDACFSGQAGNGIALIDNVGPVLMKVNKTSQDLEGAVLFTSSEPEQVSNWYPEKKHGLFTYFFLKGLQGAADADQNGQLTVSEMETYLRDTNDGVPYWSKREFQRRQDPLVRGDRERVLVVY